MRDLWIHENDLIVATHGRSFWILDDIGPLREAAAISGDHLFAPAPAYRIQRDTNTDTPIPPDEPMAANPPDGAILDYYLGNAASSAVTLEILDAHGQVVRKFSSDDKPEVSDVDLGKQLIPLYWLKPFHALSAQPGMHRFVWDLHYPAPNSPRHEYPIAAVPADTPRYPLGPTALPGTYNARLTANGKTYNAPFAVKMDPRLKISQSALEKKFQLESQLASLLDQTSNAVIQARSIRDPLEKLGQQAQGSVHDSLQGVQNKLAEILGDPAGPADATTLVRTNAQLSTLYGQVWQVDAEPTAAQIEAVATVERDAREGMRKWEALKTSTLPALNRALNDAKLPEVKIDSDTHKYKEDGGMEE